MQVKHQLLFVQGGGQGTHDEWDNKLVESLQRELGPEYEIRYPRMPREDEPDYLSWKAALEADARAIAQARVHRLPGHDHQLNNDDLKEVARAIVSLDAEANACGGRC